MSNDPKPPRIPSHEEQFEESSFHLNGWKPSENPHEGRFPGTDEECAGACPTCDLE